jgi:hypothetical protein
VSESTAAGEVLDAAISVAQAAPKKQGTNVFATAIPWTRIHRLRLALDAMGIEWRDDG